MPLYGSPRQALESLIQTLSADLHLPRNLREILIEMILGVSSYREEGAGRAPSLYLVHDPVDLVSRLRGADPLRIGERALEAETVHYALKACGPLAQNPEWGVFLHPGRLRMNFGVFRIDPTALQEPSFHRLRSLRNDGPLVLGVQRSGESVVEVRAGGGKLLYFDSSGKREIRSHPAYLTHAFVKAITRDVDPPLRNKMGEFYEKIIEDLFVGTHGCLAAVVEAGSTSPLLLHDGLVLPEPLDPSFPIQYHMKRRTEVSTRSLSDYSRLILAMLEMDGVTLFDTRGRILAYHSFVHDPDPHGFAEGFAGGARSRAFSGMKRVIGHGLYAVLYKSQDGDGEFESQQRIRT